MKKPSEFLKEMDSHGIYQANNLVTRYENETGIKLEPKPQFSKMTKTEAKQIFGFGGSIDPSFIGQPYVGGYSFAMIVANRLKVDFPRTLGRGFQFRAVIDALEKAGQ
jgi:hypothetical protein